MLKEMLNADYFANIIHVFSKTNIPNYNAERHVFLLYFPRFTL